MKGDVESGSNFSGSMNCSKSLLDKGPKVEYSAWQKFFKYDKNQEFSKDYEVAFRAALTVVVMAIPFLLPKTSDGDEADRIARSMRRGYYSSVSVAFFLFSYYKDLGNTVNLAVSGSFGVAMAAWAIWILYGVFPNSYTHESPDWLWYTAASYGGIFVFIMLWLNLNTNACIFAVTSFVWYLMAFLNPEQTSPGFAKGFEIKFDGVAGKEFVASLIGGSLACVVMCFPYKILAIDKAVMSAKGGAISVVTGWRAMTSFAIGESSNEFYGAQIKHDISKIRILIDTVAGNKDLAWWECFGFGKVQRQREMMEHMPQFLNDIHDSLFAVYNICVLESDASDMVRNLKPYIDELLDGIDEVLNDLFAVIEAGDFDEPTRIRLRELCRPDENDIIRDTDQRSLYQLVINFSAQFRKEFLKEQQKMNGNHFHVDLLSEHAYSLSICHLGRQVADYGNKVAGKRVWEGNGADGFMAWKSVFLLFDESVLYRDQDHISFVVRNWITICACFLIGYGNLTDFGAAEPKNQYKAGLASIAGVLLSKGLGSPMSKNLARLQGLIMGAALGWLLYSLVGTECWTTILGLPIPLASISVSVTLFFFVWTTFFFYMNSSVNAYVAFLLMYKSTMQLIVGCGVGIGNVRLKPIIIELMITIFIMSVVDAFFEKQPATKLAAAELKEACKVISSQIIHLFDADKSTAPIGGGKLIYHLNKAEAYASFAESEPRWHKTAWRQDTFTSVLATCREIRYLLDGMKVVAFLHGEEITAAKKDHKADKLRDCLKVDSVQVHMMHTPDRRIRQVLSLLAILDHDTDGKDPGYDDAQYQVTKDVGHDFDANLMKAIQDCNENELLQYFHDQAAPKSLELDHVCQISYELAAGRTMVHMLRTMLNGVIRLG